MSIGVILDSFKRGTLRHYAVYGGLGDAEVAGAFYVLHQTESTASCVEDAHAIFLLPYV